LVGHKAAKLHKFMIKKREERRVKSEERTNVARALAFRQQLHLGQKRAVRQQRGVASGPLAGAVVEQP